MARVSGGFFGDLSGSVGNVTFARTRGGIQTARRRGGASNPRTPAQQTQRGRFKQIQAFASAMLQTGLIRAFWRSYATGGLSTYNAFMRANSAAMPDGFDPAAGVISRGNGLPRIELADAAQLDPNTYELNAVSFEGSDPTDFLVGVIYNGKTGEAIMADRGAPRGEETVAVSVPTSWSQEDEDALFAYAFAYQVNGNQLRLSEASVRKVNANPFAVPSPDVPAPNVAQQTPFGQSQ